MSDAFAGLAHDLGTAFNETSGEPWPDDVFESWAQRVFTYQFETNPVYAAYARKRGVTPSTVAHWNDIPWVPASAFKAVPLVSGDSTRVQRVFRTSGTTDAGHRGEHHVLDLGLYRDSLIPNMRRHLYACGPASSPASSQASSPAGGRAPPNGEGPARPILSLAPAPADVPESSLSFMLGAALDGLSGGRAGFSSLGME